MADQPAQSALRLPRAAIETECVSRVSEALAEEVVSLFDQWRDRLLRYTLGFGLPVPDAEDIVQEVFFSLHRHLQQGKSRSNLRAWMFRVAHNLSLKRRSQAKAGLQAQTDQGAAWEELLPDPNPNPEDQMADSQKRARLLAAVGVLPEQDRRCLVLRAEGLRYREIAEVLNVSLGTVSMSLARSLTRLARAVQG